MRAFILSFAVFFATISLWSLATPPVASPDEPVHIDRAAAIVRGQLTGRLIGGPSSPYGIVKIPAAYADIAKLSHCFQLRPRVPASCAPKKYSAPTRLVSQVIYVARYQPLYYALVGLPSLVAKSLTGMYFMRIASAALSAIFLALAIFAVLRWSRSRLLLAGVIAAATPTVLFFGSVVNPIGLEASTAICLWTAALILARERLQNPPAGLIALVVVAGAVEKLTRSLSPFWVVLTLLCVAAVADWHHVSTFVRRRSVLYGAAFLTVIGLISIGWIIVMHALNVEAVGVHVTKTASNLHIFITALVRTKDYFKESIGVFGWLNVFSPNLTFMLWTAIFGALLLLAWYVGSKRDRLAVCALALAIILLPAGISFSQAHRLGIVWQGSDSLPLFVGLPLVGAAIAADNAKIHSLTQRWLGPSIVCAAGIASIGAFFAGLRRYAVGVTGQRLAIFHSAWHPPLGVTCLFVGYVVITIGLTILILMLMSQASPPELTLKTQPKKT